MTSIDVLIVGELNADLILRGGDVIPSFGQAEQLVADTGFALGVSGTVTASVVACLGLRVGYAGVVGDNPPGWFVADELEARGGGTAHEAGATTSLDPDWDLSGEWQLDDVFPHLDLFLPDAEELLRLSGETDIERGAEGAVTRTQTELVAAGNTSEGVS